MRIALCQIGTSTDLIDDNVAGIERCLETEADMYVFPEMFLTGYFLSLFRNLVLSFDSCKCLF